MVPDLGPPGSLTLQPHTAGISSNDHTLQPHLRSSLHPLSRFLFVLRSKDLPKCQLQTYQIIKCSSLYMLYVLLWRWRRKDGRWHCSRRMQYTRSGGIHADTPGLHGRFLDSCWHIVQTTCLWSCTFRTQLLSCSWSKQDLAATLLSHHGERRRVVPSSQRFLLRTLDLSFPYPH